VGKAVRKKEDETINDRLSYPIEKFKVKPTQLLAVLHNTKEKN